MGESRVLYPEEQSELSLIPFFFYIIALCYSTLCYIFVESYKFSFLFAIYLWLFYPKIISLF